MAIRDEFDKLEMSTSSGEIPDSIDKSSYRAFRKQQKQNSKNIIQKELKSSFNCEITKTVEINNKETLFDFIINEFLKSSDVRSFLNLTKQFHSKFFKKDEFLDVLYFNLSLNIKNNNKEKGLKYSQLIYFTIETFKDPSFLLIFKNKEKLNLIIEESKNRFEREINAILSL